MQQYLRRGRLSALMDGLGLRAALALAAVGWFVYLWGLTVPALLAGGALAVMGEMALTRGRRQRVARREAALRRRLGGEMMLEEMLLAPRKQAHFQAALLLGLRYPLTMERVTEEGMLCLSGGERLLISCVALPEACEAGQGAVADIQRACRYHGAARGVACVTGRVSEKTVAWAAQGVVPVRIIRRETLAALAGQAHPATDAELVELGKRKKRLAPGGLMQTALRREKAKTYMLYGLGLTLLYVVTGLWYYPVPGLACLVLSVVCRCRRADEEKL